MIKLVEENFGSTPKQVLSSAPFEVVLSIIMFNIFANLEQSSKSTLYPWVEVLPLWADIILIPVNIIFSMVLGVAFGFMLSQWILFRETTTSEHVLRVTANTTAQYVFLFLVGCYTLYALCTMQYVQQSSGVLAVFFCALTVSKLAPSTIVESFFYIITIIFILIIIVTINIIYYYYYYYNYYYFD
jgi:hypothetical protein